MGRLVRKRFAIYVASLAMLTALGLAALAGIRDAGSWGWFALAALAGVIGATWASGAALQPGPRKSAPAADSRPEVERPSASSSIPEQEDDRASRDHADYLMALRHEFRTPLNAVLGFSDVLLSGIDGDVNASQREDLEIIRASGIRLRVLLDGALDLSQLASGDLHLDAERVDARDLVARVVNEAGQLWSSKRAAQCALPEAPCLVEGDEARLRRSLLVLADFLATEHRNAAVALRLASESDHLAIEIIAEPSGGSKLRAVPTAEDVLASDDTDEIRRWPIAVASEVITRHRGSLYRGETPCRFVIRLPRGAPA